ncbi:MAG: hypothetical protein WC828_03090, partial [Thermoleophilia bacterium]
MARTVKCPAGQWTAIFNHAFVQLPNAWTASFTAEDGGSVTGEVAEKWTELGGAAGAGSGKSVCFDGVQFPPPSDKIHPCLKHPRNQAFQPAREY